MVAVRINELVVSTAPLDKKGYALFREIERVRYNEVVVWRGFTVCTSRNDRFKLKIIASLYCAISIYAIQQESGLIMGKHSPNVYLITYSNVDCPFQYFYLTSLHRLVCTLLPLSLFSVNLLQCKV